MNPNTSQKLAGKSKLGPAPAQRHGLHHFYDPIIQKKVDKEETDTAEHDALIETHSETRLRLLAPADHNSPACSPPKQQFLPAMVSNKQHGKHIIDIDIENNLSSQFVEWKDPSEEILDADAGAASKETIADGTAKQRLLQLAAQQARPAPAPGTDDLLEEVLADLNTTTDHHGHPERRDSGNSPLYSYPTRSFSTPSTIKHPGMMKKPGTLRNARYTPGTLAFNTNQTGYTSAIRRRISASGSSERKRKHENKTQLIKCLDSIVDIVDNEIDKEEVRYVTSLRGADTVGPPSRLVQGAGGGTAPSAARMPCEEFPCSPPATDPPAQRPRLDLEKREELQGRISTANENTNPADKTLDIDETLSPAMKMALQETMLSWEEDERKMKTDLLPLGVQCLPAEPGPPPASPYIRNTNDARKNKPTVNGQERTQNPHHHHRQFSSTQQYQHHNQHVRVFGASAGAAIQREPGIVVQGVNAPVPPPPARDPKDVFFEVKAVWKYDHETLLHLYNPYTAKEIYAHLQRPWNINADYRVGDSVNLLNAKIDTHEGFDHCRLNPIDGDPKTLIVHFPDVLLGGTRISSSAECQRKGLLSERIKLGEGTNFSATIGNIYHALFQHALMNTSVSREGLDDKAKDIIASYAVDLFDSGNTEQDATEFLKNHVGKIPAFLRRYYGSTPGRHSSLRASKPGGQSITCHASISEVLDIEEYISAPLFGLKGFVDASIKLALKPEGTAMSNGKEDRVVAPLELKTGRPRVSDQGQVLLYLLAMEERYGTSLNWGLLVNQIKGGGDDATRLIARDDKSIAELMAIRNRIASSLARGELLPVTPDISDCSKCFARTECMLTHSAVEASSSKEFTENEHQHHIRDKVAIEYQDQTSHLTPQDKAFLKHWVELIDLEARVEEQHFARVCGAEREEQGRCVSNLTIVRIAEHITGNGKKSWLYTFVKRDGSVMPTPFPVGEMLMLGVDKVHAGVCRGHLYDYNAKTMIIMLDKELRHGLLFPNGSSRLSSKVASTTIPPVCDPSVSWRLDRENVQTTFPRMRGFLYSLFVRAIDSKTKQETAESMRARHLRHLIVDLAPPARAPSLSCSTVEIEKLNRIVDDEARRLNLNNEQAAAVRLAVSAPDYALILGMPGAGKTTAIVAMIRALARAGKRVLFTSYTHSAVDNALLKLARDGDVPFVRVGREDRTASELVDYTPCGSRYRASTTAEYSQLIDNVKIWATQALGVTNALIRRQNFDVCIVDEAGQITLPAILGPLMISRSFILVGDHNQLPPVIRNPEASDRGLSEPLFARLANAHPSSIATLPVQYRMAEDIQVLPNLLIYNGQLRCGSPEVASATLRIPRYSQNALIDQVTKSAAFSQTIAGTNAWWLATALDPSRRVVFLDTSGLSESNEEKIGDTVTNPKEADIALAILRAAIQAGVDQTSLGFISPYNRQVSLLGKACGSEGMGHVECLTIDRAQGRDKDCIIVSFVKSNSENETGKLLTDARRLNVAITRAKSKLILIGNGATLSTLPLFHGMLAECSNRGWRVAMSAA